MLIKLTTGFNPVSTEATKEIMGNGAITFESRSNGEKTLHEKERARIN